MKKKLSSLLAGVVLILALLGHYTGLIDLNTIIGSNAGPSSSQSGDMGDVDQNTPDKLDADGSYTSKEDVALYLWVYGELPDNYITKKEAQKLGWNGGALEPYAPGCCIGGDRFGNYEGVLPDEDGVTYTECDIDTLGKKRGAKRLVFSSDGYIYYTDDHYESFSVIWFTDDYEMREEPVK